MGGFLLGIFIGIILGGTVMALCAASGKDSHKID